MTRTPESPTPPPAEDRKRRKRRPGSDRLIPGWVVVPLAGAAGFLTAQWAGMVFGLFVGIALWRLRS